MASCFAQVAAEIIRLTTPIDSSGELVLRLDPVRDGANRARASAKFCVSFGLSWAALPWRAGVLLVDARGYPVEWTHLQLAKWLVKALSGRVCVVSVMISDASALPAKWTPARVESSFAKVAVMDVDAIKAIAADKVASVSLWTASARKTAVIEAAARMVSAADLLDVAKDVQGGALLPPVDPPPVDPPPVDPPPVDPPPVDPPPVDPPPLFAVEYNAVDAACDYYLVIPAKDEVGELFWLPLDVRMTGGGAADAIAWAHANGWPLAGAVVGVGSSSFVLYKRNGEPLGQWREDGMFELPTVAAITHIATDVLGYYRAMGRDLGGADSALAGLRAWSGAMSGQYPGTVIDYYMRTASTSTLSSFTLSPGAAVFNDVLSW